MNQAEVSKAESSMEAARYRQPRRGICFLGAEPRTEVLAWSRGAF